MAATATLETEVGLHQAQIDCFKSQAIYRGFVGGRGVGKSFLGAFDLFMRAKRNRFYMVANPTYKNLHDGTLRSFKDAGKTLGAILKLNEGSGDQSAKIATNDGGIADVTFRTAADPETLRGPNLSGCWLDEASLMKKAAFDVVIASLREGGDLGWLLATYTPKGRSSWTHKQFQTGAPDTAYFKAGTRENPFLHGGFEATLRRQYSARLQAQELDAETLDDGDAAVNWDDLISCQIEDCLWPDARIPEVPAHSLRPRHELYMGFDVGRTRDRSVIWIWERSGDLLWCRVCYVMHGASFAEQEAAAAKWLKTGYICRCFIDQGGIGMNLSENLHRSFPSLVEGVTLSQGQQGKLAEQMGNAFSKRQVRIPDDEDLRNDFQLVSAPAIQNGKSVVKTDRDDDIGHADRFWAAALGLDAALHHKVVRSGRPRYGVGQKPW